MKFEFEMEEDNVRKNETDDNPKVQEFLHETTLAPRHRTLKLIKDNVTRFPTVAWMPLFIFCHSERWYDIKQCYA
jgi:hypothetical protein